MAIALHFTHSKVFIWNAQDVFKLRHEQRIVGNLIGCSPQAPYQSLQLGLPLQLMPEETTLLLEKGICRLVLDEGLRSTPPSRQEVDAFHEYRKKSYEEQAVICQKKRLEELERHASEIYEGRRLKQSRTDPEEPQQESDVLYMPNIENIPKISEDQAMILLYTRTPTERKELLAEWYYPCTEKERLRYRAFADFWRRGYFITCGSKFGGDFLIYTGDPARYHSSYIGVCIDYQQPISPLRLVTLGRLGSNVQKTILLCSLDEDDELCITSLNWASM